LENAQIKSVIQNANLSTCQFLTLVVQSPLHQNALKAEIEEVLTQMAGQGFISW
jgi:hypothetical protein